jgi:hypothetical protein
MAAGLNGVLMAVKYSNPDAKTSRPKVRLSPDTVNELR